MSKIGQVKGTHLIKTEILWSYPVDFVGPHGTLVEWAIRGKSPVTADVNQAVEDRMERTAAILTAEIAELLLYDSVSRIDWEAAIHKAALPLGVNHEILKTTLVQNQSSSKSRRLKLPPHVG